MHTNNNEQLLMCMGVCLSVHKTNTDYTPTQWSAVKQVE